LFLCSFINQPTNQLRSEQHSDSIFGVNPTQCYDPGHPAMDLRVRSNL